MQGQNREGDSKPSDSAQYTNQTPSNQPATGTEHDSQPSRPMFASLGALPVPKFIQERNQRQSYIQELNEEEELQSDIYSTIFTHMPFQNQDTGATLFGLEDPSQGATGTPEAQPLHLQSHSTLPQQQSHGAKKLSRKERYDKFEATETKNRGNN